MTRKPVSILWIVTCLLIVTVLSACRPAQDPEQASTEAPTKSARLQTVVDPTRPAQPTATTLPSATPRPTQAPTPTSEPTTPATTPPNINPGLPDPQGYTWKPVVTGLNKPLGLAHAGDGSGRLFVLEQAGVIRIIQGENLVAEPFLDIRDRVGAGSSEQGLLGIAFHPDYPQNGFFYLNYTDRQGDTVISRWQVSQDPNRVDSTSEVRLLQVSQPYRNHNGGGMSFGPDGYLYVGLGDGGSGGDPQGFGQSLETLLGKILRLDVDSSEPYAIPADNPYLEGGGLPEIWSYGLRNPWRFSFDSLTGDLYIGDVGQNQWEEINFLPAGSEGGANFGWDFREGAHPFEGSPPPGAALVEPITEYAHDQGCSVTGGVVYRGTTLPAWYGVYLYGDFCSGRVWGLSSTGDGGWQDAPLFDTGSSIASFGQDESGEIYLIDYRGRVLQLALP